MKLNNYQNSVCDNINYSFNDINIFINALTHSSYNGSNVSDNQRLEFLGDRVLALIISEELLKSDRDATEGQLAPRLNVLVRKQTCAQIAMKIGLGEALIMGRSEALSGGRRKSAILADAMEAVIAAVYLDGGLRAAQEVVLEIWKINLKNAPSETFEAKSALQEWAQARGMQPPIYTELNRLGPDHAPLFKIEVSLSNGKTSQGQASSKRLAEQIAAKALLGTLNDHL